MDEFLTEMSEILEEDSVNSDEELDSFESWDSLAVLSVVAMADAKFGVNLSSQDIAEVKTVQGLYDRILAKKAA